MTKLKNDKALRGTLKPSRIKKNEMIGSVATLESIDTSTLINDYARDEWLRVFEELGELGAIETTDITALVMLCDMYGVYCDMKDSIRNGNYTDKTPNGLVQSNSALTNFYRAYREYQTTCKEFGLTPISRQKIDVKVKGPKDDFLDL